MLLADSILKTKRMTLRPFTGKDLNDLSALHMDEDVMKFLVGGKRSSVEAVQKDLSNYMAHQERHGFGKWAIIHNETQEFMGRAGFVLLDQTHEIDFGYALHKKFWNQGYASELAKAMVDHAIKRWPRERIVGLILPGNDASVKVLEKVGFRYSRSHEYLGLLFKVFAL